MRTVSRVASSDGNACSLPAPLIARRYQEAVRKYLAEMDEVIRATGVDYQRVLMNEPYGEVLARFLLSRLQSKGRR